MEDKQMENKMYRGRSRWHTAGPLQRIGWIFGGIVLAVFMAFIFGYFVMLLWNWIMPSIFGLPEIDYWLAFGIIILGRLIFGGFGHGHTSKCRDDRYYGPHHPRFSHRKPPVDKMKDWRYYENFWNDEGKEAFEKYVAKKTTENEKPTE
jgi:hypothetical protein